MARLFPAQPSGAQTKGIQREIDDGFAGRRDMIALVYGRATKSKGYVFEGVEASGDMRDLV